MGTPAPPFRLLSVDGKIYSLWDFSSSKVLIVMFICSHCPYVKAIEDRIIQLRKDYEGKGVQLIGICSNDSKDYPDDTPSNLFKVWKDKEYGFPYLIDETQEIAKSYGAVCTPDIYVFDSERKLAYHGQLDNNWQEASKVTRQDLKEAINSLLRGQRPQEPQIPSMGCSIKWKKG